MNLGQNGCPEPLEFHRIYTHFSAWPPEYPIFLKYKNAQNCTIPAETTPKSDLKSDHEDF